MRSIGSSRAARVAVVVGDGEQPASLVVPEQPVGVVRGPRLALGQFGEGALGQEALVVAPGVGVGVVVDDDLRLAWRSWRRPDQASMRKDTST